MPRPAHPFRNIPLISCASPTPFYEEVRWWDTFRNGTFFFIEGYGRLAAHYAMNSASDLKQFMAYGTVRDAVATGDDDLDREALSALKKFAEALPENGDWKKLGPRQIDAALDEEPLSLIKAWQALFVLEKFFRSKQSAVDAGQIAGVDPYSVLKIVPACYRVEQEGWDREHPERNVFDEAFLGSVPEQQIVAFKEGTKENVKNAQYLLSDIARNGHTTYLLCEKIVEHLSPNGRPLTIRCARRPGGSNVRPASKQVRLAVAHIPVPRKADQSEGVA